MVHLEPLCSCFKIILHHDAFLDFTYAQSLAELMWDKIRESKFIKEKCNGWYFDRGML